MTEPAHLISLELRSRITSRGALDVWLEECGVPEPGASELVVRIEAAPMNPSDIILLFGPADLSTMRSEGTPSRPVLTASVPAAAMPGLAGRMDQALPVGNEGAGVVVRAGAKFSHLEGRVVAFRSAMGTFAQYRSVPAAECMVLPEGVSPRQGAAAFINPLTALGMVETMRREGHRALVHTAAASNVGQMLNRICLKDGIGLVNIVRNDKQADSLRRMGARHVLDSTSAAFRDELIVAVEETGATLAFDAIGGGTMASTLLSCMEQVAARKLDGYSRYGSPVHKQVYIYGVLDSGPTRIERTAGTAWGVGGWLMTWFCQKIGAEETQRLRDRICAELTTTFASHYAAEMTLTDALSPDLIAAYTRRATSEKYLLRPNGLTP